MPQSSAPPVNPIHSIISYENGELNEDEVVELFQSLIDSGLVWSLQGSYGRMANSLINQGYCSVNDHRSA